jgi:hypothetical protein
VAAVAPDVETRAEGTHLTPHAVLGYYASCGASCRPRSRCWPPVPWPSEKRTNSYPYAETAAHSDAFVPMAYWYNRSPYGVTEISMQWLARFGLPVMPVGQGYDGRIDAPYLAEDPDPPAACSSSSTPPGPAAPLDQPVVLADHGGPQWDVLRPGLAAGPVDAAPRRLCRLPRPPPPAPPFAPAGAPAGPAAPPAAGPPPPLTPRVCRTPT